MRTSKKALATLVAAHADLLATLDGLAAIEPEPCGACGMSISHNRCHKCGKCETGIRDCAECGAKGSYYRSPIYAWHPRLCFAASFGADLAGRIRRGVVPSPKQVALAIKLAAEDHARKLTATEKPAIEWLTPRSKAWKAVLALLDFTLTPATVNALASVSQGDEHASREDKDASRETLRLVRDRARTIIADRTGWDTITNAAEYADALKGASGDAVLERALFALLETHAWLVREGRITETKAAA